LSRSIRSLCVLCSSVSLIRLTRYSNTSVTDRYAQQLSYFWATVAARRPDPDVAIRPSSSSGRRPTPAVRRSRRAVVADVARAPRGRLQVAETICAVRDAAHKRRTATRATRMYVVFPALRTAEQSAFDWYQPRTASRPPSVTCAEPYA
jgi:hypothetical protein